MQTLEWDSCFSKVNKAHFACTKSKKKETLMTINKTPNLGRGREYKTTIYIANKSPEISVYNFVPDYRYKKSVETCHAHRKSGSGKP